AGADIEVDAVQHRDRELAVAVNLRHAGEPDERLRNRAGFLSVRTGTQGGGTDARIGRRGAAHSRPRGIMRCADEEAARVAAAVRSPTTTCSPAPMPLTI